MHCFVYASQRKPDTYLWLGRRDDFECIPESLSLMLGDLRFVLEVELSGERKLPQQDAREVLQHIQEQGWHLQLPPNEALATANHLAYKSAPHDPQRDH
ncbi:MULTISPECIES: YcgL domain-containing protein [unclassified Dyella]|uniref:YcgL domain-containing protein n=1 Tax=unclassified Dyella TaxID=2634549 RepID=UPI000C864EC1|nr:MULTISPECIES: YcgL domain-containing protein [unclassified Dyella]MDR3447111.1 YcgL domain-containing protein [Dyella sp.]PMQ04831.1 Protein YcgL [Dyella sp. AD56]